MQDFIASYDIMNTTPSPYVTFIQKAARYGWSDKCIMQDGSQTELPNTTLIGSFESRQQATQALLAARADTEAELRVPIALTRYIVGPIGESTVVDNRPPIGLGGLGRIGLRR